MNTQRIRGWREVHGFDGRDSQAWDRRYLGGDILQAPTAETPSLAIIPSLIAGRGSSAGAGQLRSVVDQQRAGDEFTDATDTTVAIDTRTEGRTPGGLPR